MNNNLKTINEEGLATDHGGRPVESAPSQVAPVVSASVRGSAVLGASAPGQTPTLVESVTVDELPQSASVTPATEGVSLGTRVPGEPLTSEENATVSTQLALVAPTPVRVAPGTAVPYERIGMVTPVLNFPMEEPRIPSSAAFKRRLSLARGSLDENMPKRSKVGVKALSRSDRRGKRGPITVDAEEIRSRAHVELEDLLGEDARTNVHFTLHEIDRLNDFIQNAGNIRGDITKSGLSLYVLVRHAEDLWKDLKSKYKDLLREASTARAERLLLEDRVKALEDHNTSHTHMDVDQAPLSELAELREQNAVLTSKVEELTKTIAEHASTPPANSTVEAALTSEINSLRGENSALRTEVAALKGTISILSESQLGATTTEPPEPSKLQEAPSSMHAELKGKEEAAAKSEGQNLGKKRSKRPMKQSKAKSSANRANSDSAASTSRETSGTTNGPTTDGVSGKEDSDGFVTVQRKKPRKPKLRSKSEAVAIKANEAEYASILQKLRQDPTLAELGRETKTVRRTRTNELLLILNKGAKHASHEYARLVKEVVGSDTTVRPLGTESTLQCKNLDETVTPEVLLEAISTQCDTGTLNTPVQMRKYAQGTQSAVFKLPAILANKVLKAGKIKVNWSVCPVSVFERPAACFRCQGYGHKAWGCKGPDRSKLCRRCGTEGHKAKGCKAKPKCLICPSESNNHATGSAACPCLKRALEQLRPCK